MNRLRRVAPLALLFAIGFIGRRLLLHADRPPAAVRIATASAAPKSPAAFPPPHPGQSLLVIAPHCDDETLGAGGLIALALRAGCPVHVLVLTDGDAFRTGAATWFGIRPSQITQEQMRRYGALRRTESLAALQVIGEPRSRVAFLGFPDQGLLPLWIGTNRPYCSAYTGRCRSSGGLPYAHDALLAAIRRAIAQDHATDAFVTAPQDQHPDHEAAFLFASAAASSLPPAERPRLWGYLIHYPDWPNVSSAALTPPTAGPASTLVWESLALPPSMERAKAAALRRYATQQRMMAPFLRSFIRPNELFASFPSPFGQKDPA